MPKNACHTHDRRLRRRPLGILFRDKHRFNPATIKNLLLILLFLGLSFNSNCVSSFVVVKRTNTGGNRVSFSAKQNRRIENGRIRQQQRSEDRNTGSKQYMSQNIVNDENAHNNIPRITTLAATATADLQALGWQPIFSKQLDAINEKNDVNVNTKNDKDSNSSEEGSIQTSNNPLVPLRITEVRSKTIHAVGARDSVNGYDDDHDNSNDVRDWLIPVTPGQKIINENDEKVVVAGDWILVELQEANNNNNHKLSSSLSPPRIRRILNRKSVLKRRAPGRNIRKAQLIASNLDTVFVVSSCNQDFNVARLERYTTMVLEMENVRPVIVLTKRDLLQMDDTYDESNNDNDNDNDNISVDVDIDDEKFEGDDDDDDEFDDDEFDDDEDYDSSWLIDYYTEEATSIAGGSIPVVCLDARNRDEATTLLAPWLGPGQTVAFVGSSGVGKSTLANTLCGTEVAATGDIHTDSGQGRHTTTRRQLHFIRDHNNNHYQTEGGGDTTIDSISINCDYNYNGAILDTPGLRELQLVDATQGLEAVFADLVELSKSCKFRDCQHEGEPGCAIAAAVESEAVDADRVARWFKLVAEDRLNSSEVAEGRKERERKKNLKQKRKQRQHKTSIYTSTPRTGRDIRTQAKKKRN